MTNQPNSHQLGKILLVEDNENDVILTRAAFKRAKLAIDLYHVENGQACLDFLRKRDPYADAPTPDLILLDLNMPILDGREVLQQMVADDKLNHLPVVILTTSAEEKDILTMYKLRCSSYIVKPIDFDQFMRVVHDFADYWFTVVVLPPKETRRT
ncbi:MAG: response regulator [Stenomitos rutilans HA7619-LM2]|jgi:two-component system response regulator|nr:response regulator [Stenomitos rutilans HA7619-LM2]